MPGCILLRVPYAKKSDVALRVLRAIATPGPACSRVFDSSFSLRNPAGIAKRGTPQGEAGNMYRSHRRRAWGMPPETQV